MPINPYLNFIVIALFTYQVNSQELEFSETQTLLTDENVIHFELRDLNQNGKLDLIWQTPSGENKYKLQQHNGHNILDAHANDVTTWRITYDGLGGNITLYSHPDRFITTDDENHMFLMLFVSADIAQYWAMHENEQSHSQRRYAIRHIASDGNVIQGVDYSHDFHGLSWTAFKLINYAKHQPK